MEVIYSFMYRQMWRQMWSQVTWYKMKITVLKYTSISYVSICLLIDGTELWSLHYKSVIFLSPLFMISYAVESVIPI